MGTRASYLFIEKNICRVHAEMSIHEITETEERIFCNVYFHNDGYPSGHPLQTAIWLLDCTHNGMGCLAAQFVAKFKEGAYNVYINPIEVWGHCGEDYLYKIELITDYTKPLKERTGVIITISEKTYTFNHETDEEEETEIIIFRGTPKDYIEKFSQ